MSTIKKFGELKEGDFITGSDGKPVEVVKVYDEHIPETMFSLEMDDGTVIDASGNHLWYVESELDLSLHRSRVKTARKLLSRVEPIVWEELEELASYPDHAEISLADLVELFSAHSNRALTSILVRVAESIGPVAEESAQIEDVYSGKTVRSVKAIRLYEARLFSQQLLALKDKKWEKKWPIVRGQVMTTEQLSVYALTINLPEVKPLNQEVRKV